MSQHDFDIANQGFAAFRADLNNALKALGSLSSGTAEPATTYANQLWYETDTNTLHIRNEANSAWLDLMVIDQTTGSPSFTAGNVGIGTSSPAEKLQIREDNAAGLGAVLALTNVNTSSLTGNSVGIGFSAYTAVAMDNAGYRGATIVGETTAAGNAHSLLFSTSSTSAVPTERMRIDSSGNVGIGTNSPAYKLDINGGADNTILRLLSTDDTCAIILTDNDSSSTITHQNGDLIFNADSGNADPASSEMVFQVDGTERMRIDSSGNVGIGTISPTTALHVIRDLPTANSDSVSVFDRTTSAGEVIRLRKDGTTLGIIGVGTSSIYLGSGDVTLAFSSSADAIVPTGTDGATRSGAIDLGNSGNRWDTVFATVGTINTSDRTEKQDIEELNDAERRVAVACKGLLRKYRLKSAVALKGEDARIHFGIIAQDLQAAFEAEGLDAGRYGMFIHSTWTDEETGEEKSLMGVRYSELLAFIIAAL